MSSPKIASVAEIVTQPEAHIREILRVLCADDDVRAKASRILSELENETQPVRGGSDNGLKRNLDALQDDVKICVQCEQKFHEGDNNSMNCCYHEYALEVDEDSSVWNDWDEKTFGDIDTPDNQKEFPHGFKWECCGKPADAKGCVQENHKGPEGPKPSFEEPDLVIKRVKLLNTTADSKTTVFNATGYSTKTILNTTGHSVKSVPGAIQVCVQCKETFSEAENRPRSCWHHYGSMVLETSLPVWGSFDWDDWEVLDTEEMREDYPEGFYYDCCGDAGDSKGCRWGIHKSAAGAEKGVNVVETIEISDDDE